MTKSFSHSETAPVGLLGVGLVGSALAERLVRAGYPIYAYDPSAEAVLRLERLGGHPLPNGVAVAKQCRRVILSLPGPGEVCAVVSHILNELRPGDMIIDTTTGDPETVQRIAGQLAEREVMYLDATLGGSSKQIGAGEAIVICGASQSGFTAAQDLLRTFGHPVFHTGPPGTGTRMKLVLNLAIGLHRAVLAEALEFARRSGIDPQRALEILKSGPAYSRVMDTKGQKMITGNFVPEARLAQHWKDVRLMLQCGKENDSLLPLTEVHERLLASADEAGWGLEDNSAIIKVFQGNGR
ncbi:MAG TPA: NAD(P)-dependent oxidoreductase [Bryobacteraceae bacterium]|nr:NAD(P)-dependent oxidoreductase [Bryobacteraceae bacterium]